MTLLDDAKKALGELFIMGFSDLELSDETAQFISKAGIGGIILFSHNYESPAQVAELINQVQEARREKLPLWICVDHEGGRVQRFRQGFSKIPEACAVAAIDSPKLAFELGELMGRELKAVGINVNFAPVVDINTNSKNPVIGKRAFGNTEDQVSKLTTGVLRGHLLQGVQPCVKHFPGHGDTQTDSHFALPKVDTDLDTLREREFKPFTKAFKSHCNMVMTAHILCPKIDPDRPATLSSKILREILRKELRYTKLIISDDMEMKAIADHYGAEDAPRLALEAGCDLLIYRSEAATKAAYLSLVGALESGKLAPEIILEAAARSRTLKKEVLLPYKETVIPEIGKKLQTPEHEALLQKITPPSLKT